MSDTTYLLDLWFSRILAASCIIGYMVLYIILLCGKRIRRRTYWLHCHVAISAIIRCLCAFVSGFYREQVLRAFSMETDDHANMTQVEFDSNSYLARYGKDLMKTISMFREISEFCVLTWSTFALLVLYQYYYDLKKPLALETFQIRDAVLSVSIWFVTIAFCAVIAVSYRRSDGAGYKIFINFEMTSRFVLLLFHMLPLLTLLVFVWRLHRNGFIIELLTHDQNEIRKAERIMGAKWRRRRDHSFLLVYICATILIITDFSFLVQVGYGIIYGLRLFDKTLQAIRLICRWLWYIQALAWPLLWITLDAVIRKELKKNSGFWKSLLIWQRKKDEGGKNPENGSIAINAISG